MLTRLLDQNRRPLTFVVDEEEITAKQGDTLLTAMLAAGLGHVRHSEFGDGDRAGFCWMGACQDCWVIVEGRGTSRACTTLVEPGMRVLRR
ncbi:(2Fe-2S)-binding protein [Roseomonas sp. AR75]|uniref:(2Fe-2S)-binding protein n=1 Tax=Roseomonas sp. AR75 TaxID=2562311 RepID=UPI0010C13750|nr:(2Fe-2S)-binding protein [Roseomonas sp. AR75]